MVSGNLPRWVIFLVPLAFWASECLQMASPGPAEPTDERDPQHLPIQSFRTALLKRLGLQRRPDPKPKLQVPQYLLDLYQFYLRRPPASRDDCKPPFLEARAATANTVRAFHHVEDSVRVSEGAGNSFYFLFNLSVLPLEEELTALELRLFHSPKGSHGLHINVYHAVDPPPVSPNRSRLLTCQFVTPGQPKWVSFDVTAAFQKAREQKKRDLGFLVVVRPPNSSDGGRGLPPQAISLRARRSPGEEEAEWAVERPLLVTYSHDQRGQPFSHRRRPTRSRPIRGTAKVPPSARKGKSLRPKTKTSTRCRRHRLFVDFKAVGWNDWIIAPRGYHAFYCSGDCRFPLADHMNSSSHAVVQTILNSVNSKVPKACCVPTELSPIAMLYLDQHDMVVLKSYQDMVVDGCGCR